jgi:hypothetical protein
MPNMTLALPDELHREIRRHKEIRWAEIARRAFVKEIGRLHVYDRVLTGSKLVEADAVEIGRDVRRRVHRKNA